MSNYNIISRQNYGLVKGAQIMPRKGENIYKRKDGRWEGRFRKYRDAMARSNMVMSMPEATQR